jgi:ribonuclease inhibitor
MVVFLSGAEMIDRQALHQQLKKRLLLPAYYGENLDALWDCLQYLELPLTVKWSDFAAAKQYLGEYADKTLQTFQEAQQELPGFILEVAY